MKFAIAVLMGLMTLNIEKTNALQMQRNGYDYDYAALSESSESSSEGSTDVGLEDDGIKTKWDKKNPHPGFEAHHDDYEGYEGLGKYDRQVPAHFSGPGSGDDQFMHSMITKYALELATPEGQPTGQFVFKYANAKAAAWEILETHLGLKGKEASDYMAQNFDKTFRHFDTAGDGKIEAARMSSFFRFLCGNMQITLH